MCHLIFFLPVFALPLFWMLPLHAALPVYLFVVGVSMLLYYKIYQAMRARVCSGREAMLGETGVVLNKIAPEGKIQYATEIWNAVSMDRKFLEGEKVVISGFSYGLRVIVEEPPVERR